MQQDDPCYKPGSKPSPDIKSAHALSRTSQHPELWEINFCCLKICMSKSSLGTSSRKLKITVMKVRADGPASPWYQRSSLLSCCSHGQYGCRGSSCHVCIPVSEQEEGVREGKPLPLKILLRSCPSIYVSWDQNWPTWPHLTARMALCPAGQCEFFY